MEDNTTNTPWYETEWARFTLGVLGGAALVTLGVLAARAATRNAIGPADGVAAGAEEPPLIDPPQPPAIASPPKPKPKSRKRKSASNGEEQATGTKT